MTKRKKQLSKIAEELQYLSFEGNNVLTESDDLERVKAFNVGN